MKNHCGHYFSLSALQEWKENGTQCPLCRKELKDQEYFKIVHKVFDLRSYYEKHGFVAYKNGDTEYVYVFIPRANADAIGFGGGA